MPITAVSVSKQDVPIWLRGLGTVQANLIVQIRSRVDGVLTEVPVKEGQDVKQGDLLTVIDPRPYQAALDGATAKRNQDLAQLANAQADLARYSSLVAGNFASRQQLETQQAAVKQFSAAVAGDDAQIETARLNLSFCYTTSPFNGRIGLRNIDPGNIIRSADPAPIVSVAQIQPIAVIFTLPQDNLPAIMQAMGRGPLSAVAYAADNVTALDRGTLLTPDNTIDATTGTIKLKAVFANADRRLWPGQFVNIRLLLGMESQVVTVPASAVQRGPNGMFVYRLGENDTVSVAPIEVSRQEGDLYVVSKGLSDKAVVVASGQSRLQNGAHVAIRQAVDEPVGSSRPGG